jgi:orotate phosphoribosyltransferase
VSWLSVELYKLGMIKIGEFTLSSGLKSPFYIDLRRLYNYPTLARRIAQELLGKIPEDLYDVIAGVETAGIPLATYMSCLSNKPLAYVRKERKEHGTKSAVEGDVKGRRVLVVDDVATTGSSLHKAILSIKEAGGIPVLAAVVVDREQGARELLKIHGVELVSLITATEMFRELYLKGYINVETYLDIVNYIREFKRI